MKNYTYVQNSSTGARDSFVGVVFIDGIQQCSVFHQPSVKPRCS